MKGDKVKFVMKAVYSISLLEAQKLEKKPFSKDPTAKNMRLPKGLFQKVKKHSRR